MASPAPNSSILQDSLTPPPPYIGAGRSAHLNSTLALSIILVISAFLGVALLKFYSVFYDSADQNTSQSRRPQILRSTNASGKGVDEKLIASYYTYEYGDEKEEHNECAVCLGEYATGDVLKKLPGCDHSFHSECIQMWLRDHHTCPICRVSLLPEEVAQQVESGEAATEIQVADAERGTDLEAADGHISVTLEPITVEGPQPLAREAAVRCLPAGEEVNILPEQPARCELHGQSKVLYHNGSSIKAVGSPHNNTRVEDARGSEWVSIDIGK